jgi:hypothetical protein
MMALFSALKITLGYLVSGVLWVIFNPHGLLQTARQITGQLIGIGRALVRGVKYDDSALFILPFRGGWQAVNGGPDPQTSHSWNLIPQRYAYDFVVVNDLGQTYRDTPDRPENYLAFGQPILAAADGVVVELRDGIRDYHRAGAGWIDITTPDIRGNYVVIQHSDSDYTLYAHLKAGSIRVNAGEKVAAGQEIAACGHSGHSSEPHLHFQRQDRRDFYTAIGLPVTFRDFERDSRECVAQGLVRRGQVVKTVEPCVSGGIETVNFARPTFADLLTNLATLFFTFLGIFVVLRWLVCIALMLISAI